MAHPTAHVGVVTVELDKVESWLAIAIDEQARRNGEIGVFRRAVEVALPLLAVIVGIMKLRAFSKLVDVYVSDGGQPEQVEVRDYTIKIGGSGDQKLIYEGIHQKMIVIDRDRAYVGSGEIRAPSFVVNGDVGVIQSGQAAQFWADYFLMFWSEAQVVEHRFFQSALS